VRAGFITTSYETVVRFAFAAIFLAHPVGVRDLSHSAGLMTQFARTFAARSGGNTHVRTAAGAVQLLDDVFAAAFKVRPCVGLHGYDLTLVVSTLRNDTMTTFDAFHRWFARLGFNAVLDETHSKIASVLQVEVFSAPHAISNALTFALAQRADRAVAGFA